MALTQERRQDIFDGALRLVALHGFEKVTMDQVAEATRSSKATLYRQWGSKLALVMDALRCAAPIDETVPDTGTLRGDLLAMLLQKPQDLADETTLISALLHAVKTDPELAGAIREQLVGVGEERIRLVVDRAVRRGEVDADRPALAHLALLVMSPLVLHDIVSPDELTTTHLESYLDAVVLPALGTR